VGRNAGTPGRRLERRDAGWNAGTPVGTPGRRLRRWLFCSLVGLLIGSLSGFRRGILVGSVASRNFRCHHASEVNILVFNAGMSPGHFRVKNQNVNLARVMTAKIARRQQKYRRATEPTQIPRRQPPYHITDQPTQQRTNEPTNQPTSQRNNRRPSRRPGVPTGVPAFQPACRRSNRRP
jgi:hypothetical protein